MTIRTTFNPKPIPCFKFDWEATHEPDDSEGMRVGYGKTEQEAIDDLKRLDEERADYMEDLREKMAQR